MYIYIYICIYVYMSNVYISFTVHVWAENTSQNCQMPRVLPESLASIPCIKNLWCNPTCKWLKQLDVKPASWGFRWSMTETAKFLWKSYSIARWCYDDMHVMFDFQQHCVILLLEFLHTVFIFFGSSERSGLRTQYLYRQASPATNIMEIFGVLPSHTSVHTTSAGVDGCLRSLPLARPELYWGDQKLRLCSCEVYRWCHALAGHGP